MNQKQTRVLWVGIALFGLLLVIPPWRFILDIPHRLHVERPGPYTLICNPPEVPVTARNQYGESFSGYDKDRWTVRLDTNRMALPIGLVAIVTGTLLVTLRNKTTKPTE